ncbi:hypothetical protein MMC25_007446 [Agyrium rufum]|nr:hypothetical protein [Agyrium rufum]
MGHISIKEAKSESDFDEIVPLLMEFFATPLNVFYQFVNHAVGSSKEQMKQKKERHYNAWRTSGCCHWIMAIDERSGSATGAACWQIYEKPVPWPEKPLIAKIEQIVTHPDHRRRGIANLLVKWGLEKADALGLETFVQGVPNSLPFYEAVGFVVTDRIEPDMSTSHPNAEWKEFQKLDMHLYFLWRPVGGGARDPTSLKPPWQE